VQISTRAASLQTPARTNGADWSSFFNRDVECIKRFFRRRFRYEAATWPRWKDVLEGLVAAADAEKTQETSEGGQTEAPPTSDATEGKGDVKAESEEASKDAETVEGEDVLVRLDEIVEASGWKGDMQQQLEQVRPCS
jgi:RIO kinase 2